MAFSAFLVGGGILAGGEGINLMEKSHQNINLKFNSQQNILTTEDASCHNTNIYDLDNSPTQVYDVHCNKGVSIGNHMMDANNKCVMAQGAQASAKSSFKSVVSEVLGGITSSSGDQNINEGVDMTQNITTRLSETCSNYNCTRIKNSPQTVHGISSNGSCCILNSENSTNNVCQMTQQAHIKEDTSADLKAREKTRDFGDMLGEIFKQLVPLVLAVAVAGAVLMGFYIVYEHEEGGENSKQKQEAQTSAQTAAMNALLGSSEK
jgi:hypothetical protein